MALGKKLENILGDYFGDENLDITGGHEIIDLEIDKIKANPFQTRKYFSIERIKTLAKSIEVSGLLNPITVLKEGDNYTLLAGERRLRAFKYLGNKTIPAYVRQSAALNDDDKFIISSAENLHRENLNAIELGKTFDILLKKPGNSLAKLAQSIDASQQYVQNYLNLLNLSPKVIQYLENNALAEGHVRPLVPLKHKEQDQLIEKIVENKLTSREVAMLVKNFKLKSKQKERKGWQHSLGKAYLTKIHNFSSQFPNAEVKILGDEDKGKILISWKKEADK